MREQNQPAIWQIGNPLEHHYEIPSIENLTARWVESSPAPVLNLPEEIYGVAEKPLTQPRAVIAIDIDEIIRDSGMTLLQISGGALDDMVADGETGVFDYGSTHNRWQLGNGIYSQAEQAEYAQAMRHLMLHEMMQADLVQPTAYSEIIAKFILKWRAQDVYVIANTSTLPGCETSTVEFLNKYFPGCMQGLLLPRNHDGRGKITKPQSLDATLEAIKKQTTFTVDRLPILAIDDAKHHAEGYDANGIKTFMPAYGWNSGCKNVGQIEVVPRRFKGTIDTFMAVDSYLASQ